LNPLHFQTFGQLTLKGELTTETGESVNTCGESTIQSMKDLSLSKIVILGLMMFFGKKITCCPGL